MKPEVGQGMFGGKTGFGGGRQKEGRVGRGDLNGCLCHCRLLLRQRDLKSLSHHLQ